MRINRIGQIEQIPVNQVVWEAVQGFTGNDAGVEFTIKDIKSFISTQYPDFNLSNVAAEITADCVNSPSRHWHSVNRDRYWKVRRGIYRLYRLK